MSKYATGVVKDGVYFSVADLNNGALEGGLGEYLADGVSKDAEKAIESYLEAQKAKSEAWMEKVDGKEYVNASDYKEFSDIMNVPNTTLAVGNYQGNYVGYSNIFTDNTNLSTVGDITVSSITRLTFNGCTNFKSIGEISPLIGDGYREISLINTPSLEKIGCIDLYKWGEKMKGEGMAFSVRLDGLKNVEYCLIKGFGADGAYGWTEMFGDVACGVNWQGMFYSWADEKGDYKWGTGSEENRKSLVDTFLTYSIDRSSNPMNLYAGILHEKTYNLFTDEEKAALAAKGYIWQA